MRIALLPLCLFSVVKAQALPVSSLSDVQRQQRCGDDLRCYFSADEIQIALGAGREWNEEVLQSSSRDPFSDETEEDVEVVNSDEALVQQVNSNEGAPIWSSFISNFRSCAPGCVPSNYSTYGRRGRPSCHSTGRAVDVGAIVCGGQTHKAINGGRYAEFVSCMRSKMKVIYRNGRHVTQGHHDHAHFSNGCSVAGGRSTY